MADNVTVNVPTTSGATIAADDIAGIHHQRVKVQYGVDGSATDVSDTNPMPVDDAGGTITVDDGGTTLSVDDGAGSLTVDGSVAITGTVAVTDNSGSLTVDNAALSVVGGGAEATAQRVTIANDSTGVLSVDDNGGSLTVDGTVAVSGTVAVTDNSGSLTVDNAALSVTGGGAEATALRVTIANDSTGVVSIDDNGSTISIDDGAGSITVDGTVAVSGTVTVSGAVTNAGTFAVQESGAALTALQVIDNPVVVDDAAFTPATTSVMMAGFEFDDTTPDSVNEGDAGAARMSANRNIYTTLRDAAGNERGVNVTAGNALTVDGSATTQPVSLASVPSHAVTNAGTFVVQENGAALTALQLIDNVVHDDAEAFNRGVVVMGLEGATTAHPLLCDANGELTVNADITGSALTALLVIDNPVVVDDAAFTPSTSSVMMAGFEYDDTTPDSVNEGDAGAARMSANRNIYTTIRDAAGNERGANVNASNQLSVSVDNTVTVGSHAVTNAGTFAVQVDGSALTALQLIDDTVYTDDAAFTPGTSKVIGVGLQADETSPDSVNEGDIGAPRMTLDRMAIVTVRPNATGEGLSIYRTIDLDESEEEVKASAGKVYGWFLFNAAASVRYIKFYNATAASVTVGTTTPVMTIPLPAGSAANVEFTNGIAFTTAICVAATTGLADADTGAPAANDVIANILYV